MTFKEKLVRLRKIKGLTQDEMASAVHVTRQAVYKWEAGQSYPEANKLVELKKLLGISIDDLLDDNYVVELPQKKKRRKKAAPAAEGAVEAPKTEEVKKEEVPAEAVEEPKPEAKEEPKPAAKAETTDATKLAMEKLRAAEEAQARANAAKASAEAASKPEDGEKKRLFGRLFGKK